MTLTDWLKILSDQAGETSVLEWIAIVAAVAEVLLARANNVLLYPTGLISTCIYTYLFLRPSTKLYADAILNIYYFAMSIYGWALWITKKQGKSLSITRSTNKDIILILILSLAGWAILYALLTVIFPMLFPSYKASDVAVWDAFISATAWVGMWLLAKRRLENWVVLNISNIVAIPIYLYKEMPFTAALTLFLFIVAIFGYFEWKKIYTMQSLPA